MFVLSKVLNVLFEFSLFMGMNWLRILYVFTVNNFPTKNSFELVKTNSFAPFILVLVIVLYNY